MMAPGTATRSGGLAEPPRAASTTAIATRAPQTDSVWTPNAAIEPSLDDQHRFVSRFHDLMGLGRYTRQALDEIRPVAIRNAVRVVIEAGEAPIPGGEGAQVTQVRPVRLAGGF